MKLIVKGLEYPCTAAVKTGDEIHIVDTDGNEAVFSGITNMDDYVLEGGEWSETAPTQIDRIEATAETDLQYDHIKPRIREHLQRHQCREFEKSQRDIAPCSFDLFEIIDQFPVIDHFAVDSHPFVETMDMGRRVKTDLVAGFLPDRLEHGTG